MKNKNYIIFLPIIFFMALGLFLARGYFRIVDIKGKKFISELALTSQKKEKGLGKRNNLCKKCAMLFDFDMKGEYIFWMKDMNFDLDIIWISDGKIIYIEKNVSHESLLKINPHVEADKVLEINANFSDRYNFQVGDQVNIY